jgi:hypothetical protein
MRRIIIILMAMAVGIATVAAPAAAKPDKPGQRPPSIVFDDESVACEYQPERGLSAVIMTLRIDGVGGEKTVVLDAYRGTEYLGGSELALPSGRRFGATMGYEFPSDSESTFDVVHIATLYNRKGRVVAQAEATHELVCLEFVPEPEQ